MTINLVAFDPFTQQLAADERLRIKDGILTAEKSSVRSSARSWIWLFFTRGQYSQSAILKKMSKLYRERCFNKHPITRTFSENYQKLIDRAKIQNKAFKNDHWIKRFFEAKSEIEIDSSSNIITKITKKLENQVEIKKTEEKIKQVQKDMESISIDSELNKTKYLIKKNDLILLNIKLTNLRIGEALI